MFFFPLFCIFSLSFPFWSVAREPSPTKELSVNTGLPHSVDGKQYCRDGSRQCIVDQGEPLGSGREG